MIEDMQDNNGKFVGYGVTFIRDNTIIDISLYNKQQLPKQELDRMIDSFAPRHLQRLPIHYDTDNGGGA